MSGPLSNAHTITKLPAQNLARARAFYRDKLGLEPVEERSGGLRYVCGPTEFHLFSSAGTPSGESTQMAFEVENLEATLRDLRARGVIFERFEMPGFEASDDIIAAPDNYPSKGSGEQLVLRCLSGSGGFGDLAAIGCGRQAALDRDQASVDGLHL